MDRPRAIGVLLAAALAVGCGDTKFTAADKKQVQADVMALMNATIEADVETLLRYTHPRVAELAGSPAALREVLEKGLAAFKSVNLQLESITFPDEPEFFKTENNEYAIVPVKTILVISGKRIGGQTFQLGVRSIGDKQWKYVDGGKLSDATMRAKLFPDFPSDRKLPTTSQKQL